MKKYALKIVFIYISLCSFDILSAQDYLKLEYFANGRNLTASKIQQTDEGTYLITAQKNCYTPNAVAIEGCPIARHIFEIDNTGDTLWSSDLKLWHNSVPEKMHKNDNGDLTFITSQPNNYLCDGIGVALWGFSRISQFRMTADGTLIDTMILNEECGYSISSMIRKENKNIEMLVRIDSLGLDRNTHFMIMDDGLNVMLDQILPSTNIRYYALTTTQDIKRYAIQLDSGKDSLNIVLIENSGTISESFPISDGDNIRSVQMKTLGNSDFLVGARREDYSTQERKFELIRVTQNGIVKWRKIFDGIRNGIILEKSDGTLHFLTSAHNNATNSTDVLLNVLSADGNPLFAKFYDVNGKKDEPIDAILDQNENLIILGNSNCCNMDTTYGPGSTFVLIDTSDLLITTTKSIIENSILVYPNPTSGIIYVEAEGIEILEYQVLDIQGRMLLRNDYNVQDGIDLSLLNIGTYMLKLNNREGFTFHRIIVKR